MFISPLLEPSLIFFIDFNLKFLSLGIYVIFILLNSVNLFKSSFFINFLSHLILRVFFLIDFYYSKNFVLFGFNFSQHFSGIGVVAYGSYVCFSQEHVGFIVF